MKPFLSITLPQGFQKFNKFGHRTMGTGDKKTVKRSEEHNTKKSCSVRQNSPKTEIFLPGDFTPFFSESF